MTCPFDAVGRDLLGLYCFDFRDPAGEVSRVDLAMPPISPNHIHSLGDVLSFVQYAFSLSESGESKLSTQCLNESSPEVWQTDPSFKWPRGDVSHSFALDAHNDTQSHTESHVGSDSSWEHIR